MSVALQTSFIMEVNTENPDQTAPKADQSVHCVRNKGYLAENISRGESRRQKSCLAGKELTKQVFIDELVASMNFFVAVTYIQCNIHH